MSDELTACPKCGKTNRRATVGDRVRLVDVWCPNCKTLTDFGPIEDVLNELVRLRAKWESVPWEDIRGCAYIATAVGEWTPEVKTVLDWCDANQPKQEANNDAS